MLVDYPLVIGSLILIRNPRLRLLVLVLDLVLVYAVSGSACGHDFLYITAIQLNGNNYPPQAKLIEVFLTAKRQDTCSSQSQGSLFCYLERGGAHIRI